MPVDRERHLRSVAPPDPVALHLLDRVGPVEQVEVVEESVGVGGDAHHPLLQRPFEHGEVAALAAPLGRDLLVGQHRSEARAPVDGGLGDVREPLRVEVVALLVGGHRPPRPRVAGRAVAGLEQGDELTDRPGAPFLGVVPRVEDLQEDPLRPAVVGDVGRRDAAARVVAQAERPELAAHGGDVRLGRLPGVSPGLHRVLLGGEAEGVVAHRVQDVVSAHSLEPRVDVGPDEPERVAHVQAGSRRVGEHVEHEELRPARNALRALAQQPGRVRSVEGLLRLPTVLPAPLYLTGEGGVVAMLGRVFGSVAHSGERTVCPVGARPNTGRRRRPRHRRRSAPLLS